MGASPKMSGKGHHASGIGWDGGYRRWNCAPDRHLVGAIGRTVRLSFAALAARDGLEKARRVYDEAREWVEFTALNAEMAPKCPPISERKDVLPNCGGP